MTSQVRTFKLGKIRSAEDRTVDAVISSEYPVKRWDGNEILVHTPDAVDLSRAPLPLIIAHDDTSLPVGIVEDLAIEGTELRGVLRFSKTQDSVWQDVQDGILRNLSIGYSIQRQEPPENGIYRVTKWMPYECSLVAAGADPTAQINRTYNDDGDNKMDVNDMKQTRKASMDKMKKLAETKDLTDDQKKELRTLKAEVEDLNLRIEAMEMTTTNTGTDTRQKPRIEIMEPSSRDFRTDKEYIRVYDKFLREGRSALYADEIRTLTVGSDPSMGFAVPDSFETKLVKALDENNVMRSLCRVIKTASDRKIPIVTGNTTAYWINEEGSYTASDVTLGQKTLGAHKLGVLTLASEELVHDLSFNLSGFISDDFGRAMGLKEENAFLSGDGVDKPTGILNDAELGKTSTASTIISADELIDLLHSLKAPYRAKASWLMNDTTFAAIRKMQTNDGQYIFEPSIQVGDPDKLLGRPVYVSSFMPEIAAAAKTILFGDFSQYWIADRQGRYFQELRELYAANGQIGYRANQRIDGKLVLPEAMKYLQMKA